MARTQRPTHRASRNPRLVSDNGSSSVLADDPPASTSSVAAPSGASPIRPSRRTGEADSKTPIKPSSSRTSAAQSTTSHASHSRSRLSRPAAPAATTQRDMDIYIESEMRDAIFHDRNFVDNFLAGDRNKLDAVLEYCRASDFYSSASKTWILPEITSEATMYEPVLNILNTIKAGVHDASLNPSSSIGSGDQEQPTATMFQDRSSQSIRSDEAETSGLKPDLVLFESEQEHWETVRMPIEIKKLTTHHKAGMKQLSRYARAVFAHQLHRRHLYGMMVCGTEATFVRFDRSGILYSPRMDLCSDAEGFTRAFASLLMLDRADEGYDPSFTTRLNDHGRLEYFIDIPKSALGDDATDSAAGSSSGDEQRLTRRFKVIETLCHRKSICGRATIVLRIREGVPHQATTASSSKGKRKMADMEHPAPVEYVLKLIWRDPKRESEGEVLERLQGIFGLAQYVWHCDVPGRSPTGVDETVQIEELAVCDNLKDIAVSVPLEDDNGELPELAQVDTTRSHSTSFKRKRRIYSYILMSSLGEPLWTAQSPKQFMTAVLDAILGYWKLVNLGILHRDISDGNVMMLSAGNKYYSKDRKGDGEVSVLQDEAFIESEKRLQEVLDKLDRGPTGMLSDFDLHTTHSNLSPLNPPVSTKLPEATINASLTPTSADQSHASCTVARSNGPSSKRRKTNCSMSVPISTTPSHAPTSRRQSKATTTGQEHTSQAQDEIRTTIDFRTGTPAFMSVRVLSVEPGNAYYHNYLDDLESFFWLILWSAAAHVSPGKRPTRRAQGVLNAMDECDMEKIADWKSGKLFHCTSAGGAMMANLLDSFQNDWASDCIFVSVILRLGKLFSDVYNNPEVSRTPADDFSNVVEVLQTALSSSN